MIFEFFLFHYKSVYKHFLRTVLDSVWLLPKIVVLAFAVRIMLGTVTYYEVTTF